MMVVPISIIATIKKTKHAPWFEVELPVTDQLYMVLDQFIELKSRTIETIKPNIAYVGRLHCHLLNDYGYSVRIMLPDSNCTVCVMGEDDYKKLQPIVIGGYN